MKHVYKFVLIDVLDNVVRWYNFIQDPDDFTYLKKFQEFKLRVAEDAVVNECKIYEVEEKDWKENCEVPF